MPRSTEEWIGKSDDDQIPPRVRIRVFTKYDGVCQECQTKIVAKRWICDHRIAIINGGENRESNLAPIHEACDKTKTAADVAEKSKVYRKKAKHLGLKLRKGRPFPGSRASGWKKMMNGSVVLRKK
jgi:5-methylcytosine-specific restriction protein A